MALRRHDLSANGLEGEEAILIKSVSDEVHAAHRPFAELAKDPIASVNVNHAPRHTHTPPPYHRGGVLTRFGSRPISTFSVLAVLAVRLRAENADLGLAPVRLS